MESMKKKMNRREHKTDVLYECLCVCGMRGCGEESSFELCVCEWECGCREFIVHGWKGQRTNETNESKIFFFICAVWSMTEWLTGNRTKGNRIFTCKEVHMYTNYVKKRRLNSRLATVAVNYKGDYLLPSTKQPAMGSFTSPSLLTCDGDTGNTL